jgi:hypothetical protein
MRTQAQPQMPRCPLCSNSSADDARPCMLALSHALGRMPWATMTTLISAARGVTTGACVLVRSSRKRARACTRARFAAWTALRVFAQGMTWAPLHAHTLPPTGGCENTGSRVDILEEMSALHIFITYTFVVFSIWNLMI